MRQAILGVLEKMSKGGRPPRKSLNFKGSWNSPTGGLKGGVKREGSSLFRGGRGGVVPASENYFFRKKIMGSKDFEFFKCPY